MFNALRECRFDDLRKRAARIPGEEEFHRKYADGRVRDLARTDGGRAELQARVDELLPEMLCWFGPDGERGVDELKAEGLLSMDSAELRAAYLEDITPVLEQAELNLKTDDLPWDRWNQLERPGPAAGASRDGRGRTDRHRTVKSCVARRAPRARAHTRPPPRPRRDPASPT